MPRHNSPATVQEFTPQQVGPADDDINLGAYVRALWAYRAWILIVALVCAAAAFAWSRIGGPKFEALVSVRLSQSKVGDVPEGAIPLATFRPLLESRNVATKVIAELGLDKPPRYLSASTFFGNIATLEDVRTSPVINLRVVLDDPVLAARTANLVAQQAVELSRGVAQREALRSREDLQQQRDDAKTRMDEARENLRKFEDTSQAELLRKDVDSMLDQRGELLSLLISIEREKARLAVAEKELANRKAVTTLTRTIESDPALLELARKPAEPAGNLLSLATRNEVVNPVYEDVDKQIAESRTELAALEREKAQIVDVRKLDGPRAALLTKLYGVESELTRLTVEQDLATAVYRQVATAYETAKVQVSTRSAQLEILDPAIPADQPLPRQPVRNAFLGFLTGLVIASVGAGLYHALSSRPPVHA